MPTGQTTPETPGIRATPGDERLQETPPGSTVTPGVSETAPAPKPERWQAPKNLLQDAFRKDADLGKVLPKEFQKSALPGTASQSHLQRSANVLWIANLTGVKPSDVAKDYWMYRDAVNREMFGGEAADDAQFFQAVQHHHEREDDQAAMLAEAYKETFNALLSGGSFEEVWESFVERGRERPGWFDQNKDAYSSMLEGAWARMNRDKEEMSWRIESVADHFRAAEGRFAMSSDYGVARMNATAAIIDLEPEERHFVLSLAAQLAKDTPRERDRDDRARQSRRSRRSPDVDEEGALPRTVRRVERSFVRNIAGPASDQIAWAMQYGLARVKDVSPDELLDVADAGALVDSYLSGEVDPSKANSWFGEQVTGALESLPYMGLLMHPAGMTVVTLANMTETRRQYESNGISRGRAIGMSYVAGPLQTAAQTVQARMIFKGRFPQFPRPAMSPGDLRLPQTLLRHTLSYGGLVGAEYTHEVLEFLAPLAVQQVVSFFDEAVGSPEWRAGIGEFASMTPEVLTQVALMSLIGSGRAIARERRFAEHIRNAADEMAAAGYTAEQIDDVMRSRTTGGALAKLQRFWPERETGTAFQQEALARLEEMAQQTSEQSQPNIDELLEVLGQEPTAGDLVVMKYPEVFESFLANPPANTNLPVEIRAPDGTVYPALMNGYMDPAFVEAMNKPGQPPKVNPAGIMIQTPLDGGRRWTGDNLQAGHEIITPVPSRAQWEAGQVVMAPDGRPYQQGAGPVESISANLRIREKHKEFFEAQDADSKAKVNRSAVVEARMPDGSIQPVLVTGYADSDTVAVMEKAGKPLPADGVAVAYFVPDVGWSDGFLRPGFEIITPYPTREQWESGVREVNDDGSAYAPDTTPTGRAEPEIDFRMGEDGQWEATAGGEIIARADDPAALARKVAAWQDRQQFPVGGEARMDDPGTPEGLRAVRAGAIAAQNKGDPVEGAGRRRITVEHPTNAPTKAMIADTNRRVSRGEIFEDMAAFLTSLGVPGNITRTGRMGPHRNALGFYMPAAHLIRIRSALSLTTGLHEFGHAMERGLLGKIGAQLFVYGHMDAKAKWPEDDAINQLRALGKTIYPNEPHNGWASEGFAEFTKLYITDPAQAKKKVPAFLEWWETEIVPSLPRRSRRLLERAQENGMTWYRQGALARVEQSIRPQRRMRHVWADALADPWGRFQRLFIEAFNPVYNMIADIHATGKDVTPADDPTLTITARRMSVDNKVGYMLEQGMIDLAGERTGGAPLQDAFKLLEKGETELFSIYLYARRAVALYNDPRGARDPGIAKEDAEFAMREILSDENRATRFDLAAQIVYDWTDGVLNYVSEVSPELARMVSLIRKVDPGSYIPLYRVFNEFDKRYRMAGRQGNIMGQLLGSGRDILNPIDSLVQYARFMLQRADRRLIEDQIIALATTHRGMGRWVAKLDKQSIIDKKVPIQYAMEQARKQSEVFDNLITELETSFELVTGEKVEWDQLANETLTFFTRPQNPPPGENPVFMRVVRGKKGRPETVWYEMDHELYRALSYMDAFSFDHALANNPFARIMANWFLASPARAFRMGTTGVNVAFTTVTNPLRDFRTLLVNSQASANSGQLFAYWLSSTSQLFLNAVTNNRFRTEWVDLFDRLNVPMATFLGQDTRPAQTAIARIKRGGKWRPWSVQETLDYTRTLLQFGESSARLAEVMAVAKDIGYRPGMPLDRNTAHILASAGKQVTTDFTASGEWGRVFNQMIPFFNAGIQGPRAYLRAYARDPVKFMRRGMMGTGLAIGLWWLNKDKEWWREMPAIERYLYTYIELPNQELLRIPRAFELDAIFMGMTEALLDGWYANEPERVTEWLGEFFEQVSQFDRINDKIPVPPMPTLARLWAQIGFNHDFFFDRPLIPRSMEGLPTEEQFTPYTTNVSIKVGQLLGVSPMHVEFTVRNIFGTAGLNALRTFGTGAELETVARESSPTEWPVSGVFFRAIMQREGAVARNPRSVDKLYETHDEFSRRARSRRAEESPQDREIRLMLNDAVRINAAMQQLKRLTPEREKRRELESIRIAVARDAVANAEKGKATRLEMRALERQIARATAEAEESLGRR